MVQSTAFQIPTGCVEDTIVEGQGDDDDDDDDNGTAWVVVRKGRTPDATLRPAPVIQTIV
jgi:hypothetical protein